MQSLSSIEKSCKDQISFTRNELFRSSKILLYQINDCAQEKGSASLNVFERKFIRKNYEIKNDESSLVEASSRQATATSKARETSNHLENDNDDCYERSNREPMMCSLQDSDTNVEPKYLSSSVATSTSGSTDVLKNLANNGLDERTSNFMGRRKKVGDIVSTSRSGHLIERKDEFYSSALKKIESDIVEGCDRNDNIINSEMLSSDSYDVNDNPSDESNIQKLEDTSLSDNGQSERSGSDTPCEIGILERLIRSHPVWFLRGIQRAGAVHLLQGKEEGNFIVRQSSQKDTMAVSVRLPAGKGPYIEHYLIQKTDGQLSLESSENMFESIPSLIAHYCQCCDELPVRLTLPATIREARNRQQLSSLALLGQEFWRYPMANPRPPEHQKLSPSSNKSDSLCSSEGKKTRGKENNEVILDLTPLNHESGHSSLMSTFKSSQGDGEALPSTETKPKRPHTLDLITSNNDKTGLLNGNKTPPQPPPRWTKPSSFAICAETSRTTATALEDDNSLSEAKNYPMFSSPLSEYDRNVSSPQSDQTNLKSLSFRSDKNSLKIFQDENRLELISPVSDNTNLISKSFEKAQLHHFDSCRSDKLERMFKRHKKDGKTRESAHYRESDILESPTLLYYKSNVADKQSDYEDIWATDSFITFKPSHESGTVDSDRRARNAKKPPDLLEKLENSFKVGYKEDREEKSKEAPSGSKAEDFQSPKACQSFRAQITEEFDAKQSSPFYAEPADALVVRRKEKSSASKSRHSDPFSLNNWTTQVNPYFSGGNILGRIDSQNEVTDEMSWKSKPSLSFDNIMNLKRRDTEGKLKMGSKGKSAMKGKPVRPPKIYNFPLERNQQTWAVDSSWEFIGNEAGEKEGECRFPSIEQQMESDEAASCKQTVEEMITKRFPHFKISRGIGIRNSGRRENSGPCHQMQLCKLESAKSGFRMSAYDNLTCDRFNFFKGENELGESCEPNCDIPLSYENQEKEELLDSESLAKNLVLSDTLRYKTRGEGGSLNEDNEDAQTIFSEPWDSSRWENLLPSSRNSPREQGFESITHVEAVFTTDIPENSLDANRTSGKLPRRKVYSEGMDFSAPFQRTAPKSRELCATGASIRSYALHLASDKSTTFAQNIDNFIECTLESKEANPQIVMRNMRQFMSGMKNYLVKHGEREFEKQVEEERMKLKSTEFLNLDSILEGVMHKLVVRPLREHLYKLFVDEYVKNGAIQLLYENLCYARTKSLRDLGLKSKISPPSQEALDRICHFIIRLQEVDSPLEKLDHLLASVSTIIYSVKLANQGGAGIALGADDILPLFIWVLVQSDFIAAEIEAEYMWGLLHPSLLSGEGCYYLTTLSSAVHVLKNLKSCDLDQPNRSTSNEWHCGDLKSVLKIIVPDELHGSILTKTLPVKPNMTTKDVCKIIAHKIRITNPQDYGLFRLVDGEETLLNDTDCPQDVKSRFLDSGKHCTLAYKRIDAKIGWPRTA